MPSNIQTMSVNGKITRSELTDNEMIICGYAVVFADTYEFSDWTERIDPKAFDDVDMSDTLLLRDHDYSRVLGRNNVNVRIEVDDIGLFFEAKLPQTELSRETFELVKSGICTQCSFGFRRGEIQTDYSNKSEIIIKISDLYELTITPIPAYRSTVVTTRFNRRDSEKQYRDLEQQKTNEANKKAENDEREAKQKVLDESKLIKLRKKIGVS